MDAGPHVLEFCELPDAADIAPRHCLGGKQARRRAGELRGSAAAAAQDHAAGEQSAVTAAVRCFAAARAPRTPGRYNRPAPKRVKRKPADALKWLARRVAPAIRRVPSFYGI